ncbi:MAG: hypothetical protein FWH18_06560 [Marinilabiliaceae bacterium]|nr:hypothetical protein [Marinilabiliaceae bacterium]
MCEKSFFGKDGLLTYRTVWKPAIQVRKSCRNGIVFNINNANNINNDKQMKKATFLLFFTIVVTATVYPENAVSRNGFTVSAEYRYFTGKVYHNKPYNWNSSTHDQTISLYAGWFFNPCININLGLGAGNKVGLPLFLQSKYYFNEKKNSFYAAGEVSYRLSDKPSYYRGYDLSAFLGKELSVSKRFAFNFHLGYSYQKAMFEIKTPDKRKENYHTLMLGIAFSFK